MVFYPCSASSWSQPRNAAVPAQGGKEGIECRKWQFLSLKGSGGEMQDECRVESSSAALLPRGGELRKNEGCISGDLGASQAAGAQRTVDSREEDGVRNKRTWW